MAKTQIHKKIKFDHFLYLIGAALLLTFVGWFLHVGATPLGEQDGKSSSQSLPAKDLYKSLSISDLRQVKFTSSQIQKVSDLGVVGGAHQYVFKFAVPIDNLTEEGLMTLPTSPAPEGGYPVLILCHGYVYPWSYSTTKAYLPDMEFYSEHGFAVLKPDFRGQGLSIPDGQPEGAFYSTAYNTDVLSLVAAAKKTANLSKTNISIWGHSMGAYVALRAAVVDTDIKNVILLSGPVGSPSDMFESYVAISDTSNPVASYARLNQLNAHGTPLSNPSYWDTTGPLNFVSSTSAHIQIHVGTNDKTVPPHFSADLDQALTAAHKDHQYFLYQGGNHGLVPERSLIYQRSLDLLQKKS